MSRSLLLRRRVPPEAEPRYGSVIALHGEHGGLDDLVPLARCLSPHLEVVAAEAPRRVLDPESVAYTWFSIQEPGRPEPVSFGDSLFQVEQFVYDITETHQDRSEPLYLLGYDQGALLALAISLVIPDYLSGVVAICGCLPQIAVWPLPDRRLDGLPFLLIHDRNDLELPADLVVAAGAEFGKRGGVPTLRFVRGARNLDPMVFKVAGDWLRRAIN